MPGHILEISERGKTAYTNDPQPHCDEEYELRYVINRFWLKENTQYVKPEIVITDKTLTHDLSISPIIKIYDTNTEEKYYGISDLVKREEKTLAMELYTLDRTMLYDCKREILRLLDFSRVEPIKGYDYSYEIAAERADPRAGNYHFKVYVKMHRLAKPLIRAKYNPDNAPSLITVPIVTITSPPTNTELTYLIEIDAHATSETEIATMTPFIDSIQAGAYISGSIGTWIYNVFGLNNGIHQLTVDATDINGVTGTGGELLNINNGYMPPTSRLQVFITEPIDGATITGTMTVNANVINGSGEGLYVTLFINGTQVGDIKYIGPFIWNVDTTMYIGSIIEVLVSGVDSIYQSSAGVNVTISAPDYEWLWDVMEGAYPAVSHTFGFETTPFEEAKAYSISQGYTAEKMHGIFVTNNVQGDYNNIKYSVFEFAYPMLYHFSPYGLPEDFATFLTMFTGISPTTAYDFYEVDLYTSYPYNMVYPLEITDALNIYIGSMGYTINTEVATGSILLPVPDGGIIEGTTATVISGTYSGLYVEWERANNPGYNVVDNYSSGIWNTTYNIDYGETDIDVRFMNGSGVSPTHTIHLTPPPPFNYSLDEGGNATITGYTGYNADVIIPSSLSGHQVVAIAGYAFYGYYLPVIITSITIPDSVTTIHANAILSCNGLTVITFGTGLDVLEEGIITTCYGITDIYFKGLIAPTNANSYWNESYSGAIGHAYSSSNFPTPGNAFPADSSGYGITMGDYIS